MDRIVRKINTTAKQPFMFHYRSLLPISASLRLLGRVRRWQHARRTPNSTEYYRIDPNNIRLCSVSDGSKMDSSPPVAMEPDINKLLEGIPDKPPRSKLEAHAEVISVLRRKRYTYREIARFFQEHLAITVAPSTIHDFLRVRRRRGKRSGVFGGDQPAKETTPVSRPPAINIPATQGDAQKRISALKRRALAEEPQPLFTYEEDEPLKLRRKTVPGAID
jgi:hypothetical protein